MPWDLLISNTLGGHLQPPLCPPVRVDLLQGLGLLLTNVHSGKQPPCQTYPRGLHLLSSWFTLATLLSPNHAAYRGVWGLKVLLPIFIQQGLGHTPCRVARAGIGWDTHSQRELGRGVQAWGKGFPHTVAPQWHVGWGAAGVSTPPHLTQHSGVVPGAAPRSSPPSPGSILVATPCSTLSSLFAKHLGPLLTIP